MPNRSTPRRLRRSFWPCFLLAVLQNKLTRAQYLDEVTWTTKSWLGLQKQRISVVLHTAIAEQVVKREIFINQQEITTLTVIWARQLVSPQPKLGPVP